MRITNGILASGTLSGLQSQMKALDRVRREATTGVRVARPSDDPVAAAGVMQSSSGLRALEQYRRNLQTGGARLSIEDSVLEQVSNVLMRAKDLAISQADSTASAATRATTKAEIDRLVDFVADLGNTQYAGSYIFGGQYADTQPFTGTVVDSSRPPSGDLRIEVGAGQWVNTNHSAQEIFIDTGVVDALKDLSTALGAGDEGRIQAAIPAVDNAFDAVQELVGDLGARMSQMDVALENLESLEVNLQTFRSQLSDADLAEAVTELVSRQNSLQAAMLANSRILRLTLTDYL